jgi:hypothetical protein
LHGEEDPMKSANPLRASAATSTHRPKMHKRSGECPRLYQSLPDHRY